MPWDRSFRDAVGNLNQQINRKLYSAIVAPRHSKFVLAKVLFSVACSNANGKKGVVYFCLAFFCAGVTPREERKIMRRANAGLGMALVLAMLSLVSGQFFVNLGDKTKAPGTDVDTAAAQGSVPATQAATDGDVQVQADPNVKLQVIR